MPIDPQTGVFSRSFTFVDNRIAGQAVTRSDLDAAFSEYTTGINSAIDLAQENTRNYSSDYTFSSAGTVIPVNPPGFTFEEDDVVLLIVGGVPQGRSAFSVADNSIVLTEQVGPGTKTSFSINYLES